MRTHRPTEGHALARSTLRTAASVLALALGLTACAGGVGSPPGTESKAQSGAMLLKIADETDAGGDPATAASLYRQLHELSPKDPVPLARLAGSLLRMGEDRMAADTYRAALALDRDNPDFRRGLALALLLAGDTDGALSEVRAALQTRGSDPRLYNLLGVGQDMAGRHDLAQQTYRHGIELAPANLGLRNNYALSLALAGDYAGAVTELRGIAGPEAAPRYRLNLALAYGLAGDDAKAAAAAREVLDERSVESNLANYALLRGMDAAQRTTAILGGELEGAARAAGGPPPAPPPDVASAAPRTSDVGASSPAEPIVPPPPVAVAVTSAPTLPAPLAPPSAVAAVPPPSPPVKSDAMRPAPPQSRAATSEVVAQLISTFLDEHLPVASLSDQAQPDAPSGPVPAPASAAETADLPEVTVTASRLFDGDGNTHLADEHFSVQLGSFVGEAAARKLASDFVTKGIAAAVSRSPDRDGREWFVVRAGDFTTADPAREMLGTIHSMGCAEAIVVHLRVAVETRA